MAGHQIRNMGCFGGHSNVGSRTAINPHHPDQPMCLEPEKVKAIDAVRLNVDEHACGTSRADKCSRFHECPYQNQDLLIEAADET